MGDRTRGTEPADGDRDGLLDRDGERSMGVLVVVFFAVTR